MNCHISYGLSTNDLLEKIISSMDKYTKPDWSNSALLTIDVQEDFTRPDAPAYIDGTDKILPNIEQLLQYFRDRQWPVFHIARLYEADGSNADICRRQSIEQGQLIATPGSDGAELAKELKPDELIRLKHKQLLNGEAQQLDTNEWVLYKPRWGAFYGTNLEQILRKRNISTLVVTGCNFPNCPRTTIYEASERDFRTVLVRDALSGLYKKGEQELQNIGVAILDTRDIIEKE